MPLQRRLPKFGFKNINRVEFKAVNICDLQKLAETANVSEIDVKVLSEAGLVSAKDRIKILGDGNLSAKLTVSAHAFSKSAVKAIEAVGGNVVIVK
jgi:large subunit ribosomal protein L15